jgi:hypothetical protein
MSKAQCSLLIGLTAAYTPITATTTLFKGTLTAPDNNAATAYLLSSDGHTDIPIPAGKFHEYSAVDLATIRVKGTPGDTLTLVGESVERIEQGMMY